MEKQLLHTPEGVRDIYSSECLERQQVERQVGETFRLYGYAPIETPVLEFFDIFRKERGSVGTREMYKLFDRENNTLVLRPDMTPSIARCVAKYYSDWDGPIRLSYMGPAFINSTSFKGRLNQTTQTGVEFIGDDSTDADAESIALAIAALKASGLGEFQVEIGDVNFFRGLLLECGVDEETGEAIRGLIEEKNFFAAEELLHGAGASSAGIEIFSRLPGLFGDIDAVRKATDLVHNDISKKAIDRLSSINDMLSVYGLSDYVSYDLGMVSKYSYYSGVIFKAFTYGTGDYVVTGGRYDGLLKQFGPDLPAIGFAIVIDRLMQALSAQHIPVETACTDALLVYDTDCRAKAIALARQLRHEEGGSVEFYRLKAGRTLDTARSFAARKNFAKILYVSGEGTTELDKKEGLE